MIRAIIALVFMAAAASASFDAAARPLRVMSINGCGDQLVLALLPPSQITSVTWLSRDPASSIMAAAAMTVPVNRGAAEEVLDQHPDLVIAGAYTTPAARRLIAQRHVPMLQLAPTDSFDDIRRETRRVAAAVGAQGRGEAMIARMDATLRALAASQPANPIRVAAWDGAGFAAEPGSLYDVLLRTAGARNVAADLRAGGRGAPGVETLLATAPDLLVEGQPGFEPHGLRSDMLNNPIVRRYWGDRLVVLPTAYYACGTPFSADGARRLHDALQAAARSRRPLPFAAGARP